MKDTNANTTCMYRTPECTCGSCDNDDRGGHSNLARPSVGCITDHNHSCTQSTMFVNHSCDDQAVRGSDPNIPGQCSHDSTCSNVDDAAKTGTTTRSQKIVLVSVCISQLLTFLNLSILAPFFPKEANKKHVDNTLAGWIFGSFSLVQFFISPLFGKLTARVGSRFMYLSGIFMSGCFTLIFGTLTLIPTDDGIVTFVVCCFVTRILLAIGSTAVTTSGILMLTRTFPDNVGFVFGIVQVFTGAGLVVGPALGGFLYEAEGFILPFAVIGGCAFVILPVICIILPHQEGGSDVAEDSPSIKTVCFHPKSVVNSISLFVAASFCAMLDPTLEPYLRMFSLKPAIVGILFLIMAVLYSLTSPLWGWLAKKLPDKRVIVVVGFLLATVSLLLLGTSPVLGFKSNFHNLGLVIASLALLGVAASMCIIPTYDIYTDVLSDLGYHDNNQACGIISGLWVSMYALGAFAGPSLGGYLFETIGFQWLVTWFSAACLVVIFLVGAVWCVEVKCRSHPSADSLSADERTALLGSSEDGVQYDSWLATQQKQSMEI